MRRLAPLLLLALVAVLATGCDLSKPGGSQTTATPETVVGTVPKEQTATVTAQYKNGDPTAGKQVFETAGCSGCHTLADANAHGTVGPNLDQLKPPFATVQRQVINGGGAMPAFKDVLSDAQIEAVARTAALDRLLFRRLPRRRRSVADDRT